MCKAVHELNRWLASFPIRENEDNWKSRRGSDFELGQLGGFETSIADLTGEEFSGLEWGLRTDRSIRIRLVKGDLCALRL